MAKGTPNRTTREVRALLRGIVEQELSTLPERLAAMPEEQRLALVVKLISYVLPKLESTSDHKEKVEEQFAFFDTAFTSWIVSA